jgi:hypothetical protein
MKRCIDCHEIYDDPDEAPDCNNGPNCPLKLRSALGDALFDMMKDMTGAQAHIYRRSDLPMASRIQAAGIATQLVEQRHRPLVLQAIKRPSRGEGVKQ